jgi:anti-sigma B factor antagonist
MTIIEQNHRGVPVLKVAGARIDAASASSFRQTLAAFVDRGVIRFVIDLSAVGFIDSTGLGALVSALKTSGPSGEVVVAGARESVATLFRLTRMDKVFRMFPTEAEAAAALLPRAS